MPQSKVPSCPSFSHQRAGRRGQALLEFGIICFLLFTIVIGTLSYGIQLWQAIMLQQAVDGGTIAASRTVLPVDMTFAELMDPKQDLDDEPVGSPARNRDDSVKAFRANVYDPQFLVVRDSTLLAAGQTFAQFMSNRPTLNRLLSPLMIRDGDMHRFPGTLVSYTDANGTTLESVLIPVLTGRGTRTLRWRFPVEELTYVGTSSGNQFSVLPIFDDNYIAAADLSGGQQPPTGLATLRINYPHQSSTAIAFQYRDDAGNAIRPGEDQVRFNDVIFADESLIVDALPTSFSFAEPPPGVTIGDPQFAFVVSGADVSLGPFSGQYGLGRFVAGNTQVRPFRQVMTFQAARLREVLDAL